MKNPLPQPAVQVHGWVLFDGECRFCTSLVHRYAVLLQRAGFMSAPLQTPWVGARLGLPAGRLPGEVIVLTAEGRVFGGVDAILHVLRWIWWGWPLFMLGQLPGVHALGGVAYRLVARHRHCLGGVCRLPRQRHHGPVSFFEMP
jgi:predicted DCC family thiol-disulfide oxidoreductase YuxK